MSWLDWYDSDWFNRYYWIFIVALLGMVVAVALWGCKTPQPRATTISTRNVDLTPATDEAKVEMDKVRGELEGKLELAKFRILQISRSSKLGSALYIIGFAGILLMAFKQWKMGVAILISAAGGLLLIRCDQWVAANEWFITVVVVTGAGLAAAWCVRVILTHETALTEIVAGGEKFKELGNATQEDRDTMKWFRIAHNDKQKDGTRKVVQNIQSKLEKKKDGKST